jgi:hypothetical protein
MHDKDGRVINPGDDVYSPTNSLCQVLAIDGNTVWVQPYSAKDSDPIAYVGSSNFQKVRSLQELAKEAFNVQDACNLSGVVHSFSRLLTELRIRLDFEKKGGTENVNRHPIAALYSSKIASLTGSDYDMLFSQAYDQCCKIVER